MIITEIETIPLSVPSVGRRSSLGAFQHFEYGLVIVRTDEGIEGYGEICTLWDGAGPVQAAFVEHAFAPRIIGQEATAISRRLRDLDTLSEGAWPARAAIEMALFDITGKACGVPVYQLLGGRTRESVTLSRSVHMQDVDLMAEEAAKYVSDGFSCVKVKVGLDIDTDIAAVKAIRDAVGSEVLIRLDANMGWRTPKQAIRAIRQLEQFGIHSVEQPLPPGDTRAMVLVRQGVDTPIMVDESVWGPRDAWELLESRAVDLINVYVAESGGLSNSSLIFRMAELTNVGCLVGAMPEMGVGTSAGVHLAVSMTNLHDPCDASGVLYHQTDIVNERFRVTNGQIWPLEGPGLGVTIDWDVVDSLRS